MRLSPDSCTDGALRQSQLLTNQFLGRRISARNRTRIMEIRFARLSAEATADSAPNLAPLIEAYRLELKESALTDWPGVLALPLKPRVRPPATDPD